MILMSRVRNLSRTPTPRFGALSEVFHVEPSPACEFSVSFLADDGPVYATRKARKPLVSGPFGWWRGQDLNLRPSGYEIETPRFADLGTCREITSELVNRFATFTITVRRLATTRGLAAA